MYGQAVEAELSAATKSYFNGEAVLTSALDYVTSDTVPQGYILTGHGANKPSETLVAQWGLGEIIPTELDLSAADAVPADANCLILFAPTEDITEHEAALIEDYMKRGGSFLLVTSPACVTRCPRAMALGVSFGLTAERGTVADASTNGHYGDSFYYISPTISNQHGITYSLSSAGYAACLPNAHAISSTRVDGVTATSLMTTSESGQLVVSGLSLGGKKSLCLAATAAKTVQVDGEQRTAMFTWFGSADAFTDSVNAISKEGNYNYLTMSILWMSQPFSSRYASLPADCIDVPYLAVSSAGVALLWGVILAVVLPGAVLTGSIVVWHRRKRT
jgi:ABC-2 type transport system permease protein